MTRRLQSRINYTDACSTGNKQAGLVNSFGWGRVPRNILKSKTATGLPSANGSDHKISCGTCGTTTNANGNLNL